MKTLNYFIICSILILFSIVITSCKNERSAEDIRLETAHKQLIANLKMYTTTWENIINKREIDQINGNNFDKNVTLVTSPQNIVGIEGFKAYYNNYLTGFSNIKFTIVDAFGQDDKIVKHWNFRGTNTGKFFGIPATGKEVNIDGVTLVKMKDGKIAQEQDFFDNLEFMQQLGVISGK